MAMPMPRSPHKKKGRQPRATAKKAALKAPLKKASPKGCCNKVAPPRPAAES